MELDRHKNLQKIPFSSLTKPTLQPAVVPLIRGQSILQHIYDGADKLVIANTKGFTGHPMAVGIEDASMLYGMLTGRIPPIANHQENDLTKSQLSKGGDYPNLEYGLRFGAGFGSQIALLPKNGVLDGNRIDGKKFMNWIRSLANSDDVVMRVLDGKLVSYVDANNNLHGGIQGTEWLITESIEGKINETQTIQLPQIEVKTDDVELSTANPSAVSPTGKVNDESSVEGSDNVVSTVIDVVVKHTGYPADFVELDQDLSGELGIDTVKQAEIMAEIAASLACQWMKTLFCQIILL